MPIDKVFANLSCADPERSRSWFASLFGREPDAAPMPGLLEWHHGEGAGFQLHKDAAKAGQGTLTLIVSGLRDEHRRLADAGIAAPAIESGDKVSVLRLSDPDGNLVVLAQPGSA